MSGTFERTLFLCFHDYYVSKDINKLRMRTQNFRNNQTDTKTNTSLKRMEAFGIINSCQRVEKLILNILQMILEDDLTSKFMKGLGEIFDQPAYSTSTRLSNDFNFKSI